MPTRADPAELPVASTAGGTVNDPQIETAASPRQRPDADEQRRVKRPTKGSAAPSLEQRRAVDYASTRLVNFRIPVDLHDRFRALVREAEDRHPRLRKQSLTELVIALLEEGPQTADEVADLIRRKRLAEHEER
jgi:hypothetical protein